MERAATENVAEYLVHEFLSGIVQFVRVCKLCSFRLHMGENERPELHEVVGVGWLCDQLYRSSLTDLNPARAICIGQNR